MKIFLDLGYYYGKMLDTYKVDNSWKVYAWEPNKDIKVPRWVSRKAAWINNGREKLNTQERNDAAYLSVSRGAEGNTTVSTFDFSELVSKLPDAYIVCSMDIEGGEFEVLKKMLEENTIDKIDLLDIEFHHRLMTHYTDEDAKYLIKQIKKRGVKIKLKEKL